MCGVLLSASIRIKILYLIFYLNLTENVQHPMCGLKRNSLDNNNQGNSEVLCRFYERSLLFNLFMGFYMRFLSIEVLSKTPHIPRFYNLNLY